MAYRYATKELSIANAKAFLHAASMQAGTGTDEDSASTKKSVILYAVLGRTEDWTNEPNPNEVGDNDQYIRFKIHREAYGAKKINADDMCHVIPRYDWTSGTSYSMYRDTDVDMYDKEWYVKTDQNNVYVCLFNNKGGNSTIKPTGFSTIPFTTSDGYIWKYMYTISLGDANKFLTTSYIPVRNRASNETGIEAERQIAVQNAAGNGNIEVIEVNNGGSNYLYVANGVVTSAGQRTITLSSSAATNASSDTGSYTRSSVYIKSGTGSGQLRRIINYDGTTRTLTVNTAFSTVCNTDSRVVISPTISVIGDGQGLQSYATVNNSTGAVETVVVTNRGSGYTSQHTKITANGVHGSGATANAMVSPTGGWGSDMIRQLHADKLMLNVQTDNNMGTSGTGAGYVPSNTEFRTVSIMKDPVLKVNSNNVFQSSEKIANTSNSPETLRLGYRLKMAYNSMDGGTPNLPVTPLQVNDLVSTNAHMVRAAEGDFGFITDTGSDKATYKVRNAFRASNGTVYFTKLDEQESDESIYSIYINNVDTYAGYKPYEQSKDIIRNYSATQIGQIIGIKGPEANTYSGEILYTENVQAVERDPDQIEDLKIILDF